MAIGSKQVAVVITCLGSLINHRLQCVMGTLRLHPPAEDAPRVSIHHRHDVDVRGGEIEPGERALTSWPVQNNKKLICPNQRLKQLVAARQGLFAAALSVEDVAQSTWLQAA